MTPVCIRSLSAVRNNSLATICGVFNLQGYIFIILNLGVLKKKLSVRISTVNEYTHKCPTIPHPPYVYKYTACHHCIHNTTCNCHPSTSIFPHPSLYVPHSAPFSRSPLHGPYTGEFRGHTHSYPTHTHYRTNLRAFQMVWVKI